MSILGAGWINETQCGEVKHGVVMPYDSFKTLRSEDAALFSYAVKNFGRFDRPSKFACCAVALALKDAGVTYEQGVKLDVGLVGTNRAGALEANKAYYGDFCECGKTLARGNLFIYTLPSSPLAEVSIHFGLQGPLLYARDAKQDLQQVTGLCGRMVADGQAKQVVLVAYGLTGAVGILLDGDAESSVSDLDQLGQISHIARLFDLLMNDNK